LNTPEQQIRQLSEEMSRAIVVSDMDTLGRGWAEDYRFTNERGDVVTKAQLLEVIASGVLTYESVANDDIEVRIFAGAALMTGNTSVAWQVGGQRFRGLYRFTEVYINREGRWQAVAGHVSRKDDVENG
jgi:Domain of unknown function (DUF4440)